MGLGGYLTWTALSREIHKKHGIKSMPVEVHGSFIKLVKSEIFYNNPTIIQEPNGTEKAAQIQLNNPLTNYCIKDTHEKAYHKFDSHIIETICKPYGIENPELKCEIYLDDEEKENVHKKLKTLPEEFITIEPFSKKNYTPNRIYPFEKWQKVVNIISKKIPVVQIGVKGNILENAINFTGKTSFREATGIIENSNLFVSSEGGLVHAATSTNTKSLVVITGYQKNKMVAYPQNININISNHGPCGLKIPCKDCIKDADTHDFKEIVKEIEKILCL